MSNRNAYRWLLMCIAILAVILIPFFLFGDRIETWTDNFLRAASDQSGLVAIVLGLLLASDILLPVPSSMVAQKTVFCGKGMERIPVIAFRMMSFIIGLKYIFSPVDARVDTFGIKEGFTVIDYGCGPGGYLKRVSRLVGGKGKLYAVDMFHMIREPSPFLKEYIVY